MPIKYSPHNFPMTMILYDKTENNSGYMYESFYFEIDVLENV
jgi:hypothetical protein